MRLSKTALLGGVAALALGVGTAGFGVEAEAFDNVNWKWDRDINEIVTKNINIDINIRPIGDVSDQVLQMQIGNVNATSSTHGITNYKPLEEVSYKVGYEVDYGLTIDGSHKAEKSGSGSRSGSFNRTQTNSVVGALDASLRLRTSSKTTQDATLSGSLKVEGDDALFVGGAGAAAGFFTFPPLNGGVVGAGVIGVIGASAVEPGEASFEGSLGTKTSKTTDESVILNGRLNASLTKTEAGSFNKNWSYSESHRGRFNKTLNIKERNIVTVYDLDEKVQDALKELPEVIDQATAIGNLITVDTDTPVQEVSAQILFDTVSVRKNEEDGGVNFKKAAFDLDADLDLNDNEFNLDTKNHFHDVALLLGLAAGAGLIEQAEVTSSSKVYDIYNATGSAAATSIGNLKSINVDTNNGANGLVIADVTQLSVANVKADATAYDIDIVNYTNLGKLDRAIARSTATAIGNSLNITVNSGQGPVAGP